MALSSSPLIADLDQQAKKRSCGGDVECWWINWHDYVKVDEGVAGRRTRNGQFVAHGVPEGGQVVQGHQVGEGAYRVARIRWMWDLQRPRYKEAAVRRGDLPSLEFDGREGRKLAWPLHENEAADVDLVISYNKPFWPDAAGSLRDNARLGPLRNGSGMWLTGTTYRRSQAKAPWPERLVPRPPAPGEFVTRLLCGGLRPEADGDMYWFVDAITSDEALDSWPLDGLPDENFYR